MWNIQEGELDQLEYIQLAVYNVHCNLVGRMFSREKILKSVKNGIAISPDLCYSRIDGKEVHHALTVRGGNRYFRPDMSTLTLRPKPDGSSQNIGRVLCDLEFEDGTVDPSTPRTAAMLQLKRLHELGFVLKSSFETEFILLNPQRRPEAKESWHEFSINSLDDRMDFFMELVKELKEMNVPVESLQTESDHNFYEIALELAEGIQSADGTALVKNHLKALSKSKGYIASFMSKDVPIERYGIGLHFNHSLWTQDGTSAFVDHTADNRLSDVARHWLAGLVAHGPALTALSAPTVNCYRPIHHHPQLSNWAMLDKSRATFVVRQTRGDNIYIEDRLPGAASNPYLVMAATLAAGIDGIKNKLPLPKSADDILPLPKDLESALTCLQSDTVMVESLGQELVDLFVSVKSAEINHLKNLKNGENDFQNEFDLYFQNA